MEEIVEIFLFNQRDFVVSSSVRPMGNKMHDLNRGFNTGAGPSPIREDSLESERLRTIQENNWPALKNAATKKVSVAGIIALLGRVRWLRVREVFGAVRNLAISVFFGTAFIDRLLEIVFSPKLKISSTNFKPVPILAIKDQPRDSKDKNNAQYVIITERDVPRSICVAAQMKFSPIPKLIMVVTTGERELI